MKKDARVMMVSCPSRQEARRIADSLLDERLVACASIIAGAQSRYWWKGKIETATEALLIMKTRAPFVRAVTKRVVFLHSYDVPEVIALPVVAGSAPYLKWIEETLTQ